LKKSIESFFELISPKPSNWINWNLQWILWWLDRIIESLPFVNLGKPKKKSIEISTKGSLGIGKRVYKSYDKTLDLTFLHEMHLS
jgi:hypothetical protein